MRELKATIFTGFVFDLAALLPPVPKPIVVTPASLSSSSSASAICSNLVDLVELSAAWSSSSVFGNEPPALRAYFDLFRNGLKNLKIQIQILRDSKIEHSKKKRRHLFFKSSL